MKQNPGKRVGEINDVDNNFADILNPLPRRRADKTNQRGLLGRPPADSRHLGERENKPQTFLFKKKLVRLFSPPAKRAQQLPGRPERG